MNHILQALVPQYYVYYLVIEPNVKAVTEESVIEEPVGHEEGDENDYQVEEFAEDEPEVVDVVLVVYVVGEKLKQK